MSGRAVVIRLLLAAMLAAACRGHAAFAVADDGGDWAWPAAPPLRVFSFHGYWAPALQLDRAWARLGGVEETSRWSAPVVPATFPTTRETIGRHHLIVAVDMDVPSWPAGTPELCREYVRRGGAMIFFGGRHAFASGYAGSPLEELSPVTFRDADSLLQAPEGMILKPGPQPAGPEQASLDWAALPRAYRLHRVEPKPGSLVFVQADGHPVLVAWQYGKGRVAVFAGTVMGDPPTGQTPFWAWRDWPDLMVLTVRWLTAAALERKATNAPPPAAASKSPAPAAAAGPAADGDDLDDLEAEIDQISSEPAAPTAIALNASPLADPETVRRQTADRRRRRLEDLVRAGEAANPDSIPMLRQVVAEHRRDRTQDPHQTAGRTEADELHDEALLAAVLCGDAAAVGPLVDLLLQLDFTVIGMFGRGWGERDQRKRDQIHDAARAIRAWSWDAGKRLRGAPDAVLPALAARIAEEKEPWIVPLAHRLFGASFRDEKLPAATEAALRKSTIPAIRELVVE